LRLLAAMKTKTKRSWLALAVLIAFAVAAGLLWRKHSPPQIITLPSGEQFEFVTAEWGTNKVQPTATARFIAGLPTSVASYVYRKWGSRLGIVTPIGPQRVFGSKGLIIKPPEPALHFWFRSLSTNSSGFTPVASLKFMLADKNGVVAGQGNFGWGSYGQGADEWLTFAFPTLPRRSDTLQLLVFKGDEFTSPYTQVGAVRFQNPLLGQYPNWQPESLPVTKTNDDLTVQLTDFRIAAQNKNGIHSGASGTNSRFHPPGIGEDRVIVFKLNIRSPRGTNEHWLIQPAELSDATGNRVSITLVNHDSDTDEYYFGPALWPEESAWRLKLALRRFLWQDPEEIVTFTNVSVPAAGATSTVFQTNLVHGVPVVLKQEFTREDDSMPVDLRGSVIAAHATVELLNPPEGVVVDWHEWKSGTSLTTVGTSSWRGTDSATVSSGSIPAGVRTLDISWAVQKSRTVEFFVKPPKVE
jgi:hypothetical protein